MCKVEPKRCHRIQERTLRLCTKKDWSRPNGHTQKYHNKYFRKHILKSRMVRITATHRLGTASAAFAVRPSPIAGLGLFATRNITKGTLITFYDGERVVWSEAKRRPRSHMRSVAFGYEAIDGLRGTDTLVGRGAGSLCNHAFRPAQHPNATYWPRDDQVWIKAIVDIPVGAEVLVDYGRGYWANGHDTN